MTTNKPEDTDLAPLYGRRIALVTRPVLACADRWMLLAPMQAFGILLGVERDHVQLDTEDGGFLSVETSHVLAIAPVA